MKEATGETRSKSHGGGDEVAAHSRVPPPRIVTCELAVSPAPPCVDDEERIEGARPKNEIEMARLTPPHPASENPPG